MNDLRKYIASAMDRAQRQHLRFLLLLNIALYAAFALFRFYGWAALSADDPAWLLGREFVSPAISPTPFSFYRIMAPLAFFALAVWVLHARGLRPLEAFRFLLAPMPGGRAMHAALLLVAGLALAAAPGALTLIREAGAVHGRMDADSYHYLVAYAARGVFNPIAEPGLIFSKYYPLTMPAIALMKLLGHGTPVVAYNIVVSALACLTVINMMFLFLLLASGSSPWRVPFFLALLVATLSGIRFPEYFNYHLLTQVFFMGFFGSIGGVFVMTSMFYSVIYCIMYGPRQDAGLSLTHITMLLFTLFIVENYYHLLFFIMPGLAMLAVISTGSNSGKRFNPDILVLAVLYTAFACASYLTRDFFPSYSIRPYHKLAILGLGLTGCGLTAMLLRRMAGPWLDRAVRWAWPVMATAAIVYPFFWFARSGDNTQIFIWEHPMKLGAARIYFFFVLTYVLAAAAPAWLILKALGRRLCGLPALGSSAAVALAVFALVHAWDDPYTATHPAFFSRDQVASDRSDKYAYDAFGVRLTYDAQYVSAVEGLWDADLGSTMVYLLCKKPSNSLYQHGFAVYMLQRPHMETEGLTFVSSSLVPRDKLEPWLNVVSLTDADTLDGTVRTYEEFESNVFKVEKATRSLKPRFKSRILIMDRFFDRELVRRMEESGLFVRMSVSPLYTVFKMPYPGDTR